MNLFDLVRPKRRQLDEELEAYRRLYTRGFRPGYITDVGAHVGGWTRGVRDVFGTVPTLMVEPQEADQPRLRTLCDSLPLTSQAHHVLTAEAGQTVTFYQLLPDSGAPSSSGSSLKPERSDVPRREIEFVSETLDRVAGPHQDIFLKIDAQGAELDVLRGGEAVLARCALVQLEVSVMRYNEGAPTMLEVLAFMDARGFSPIDVSGRTRIQGHLVQMDIIFAPAQSPLRKDFFEFSAECAA